MEGILLDGIFIFLSEFGEHDGKMELKEKVAFITGGASGLGKAAAENFVDAGAKVMLFDLNPEYHKFRHNNLGFYHSGKLNFQNENLCSFSNCLY